MHEKKVEEAIAAEIRVKTTGRGSPVLLTDGIVYPDAHYFVSSVERIRSW